MHAFREKQGGFTLIELSLVVLLLALITVIGLPSFTQIYERSEMRQAASDFIGAIRYAQQRAVMERIPIRLYVDVEEQTYWVPVEEPKERRHYRSRRRHPRRHPRASSSNRRRRVNEVKEIHSSLPKGYIFEFVYKVAEDNEIRRGEGEFTFYPEGSADAAYFTILRLAKKEEDERRIFIKIVPTTGRVENMTGQTEEEGSDFYRGYYESPSFR